MTMNGRGATILEMLTLNHIYLTPNVTWTNVVNPLINMVVDNRVAFNS